MIIITVIKYHPNSSQARQVKNNINKPGLILNLTESCDWYTMCIIEGKTVQLQLTYQW